MSPKLSVIKIPMARPGLSKTVRQRGHGWTHMLCYATVSITPFCVLKMNLGGGVCHCCTVQVIVPPPSSSPITLSLFQAPAHRSDWTVSDSLFFREPNEQMVRNPNSSSTPLSNTPLSPVKNSLSGQTGVSSLKPGPLPANLDDLKVYNLIYFFFSSLKNKSTEMCYDQFLCHLIS